jgi:hypothetical protein
MAENKKSVLLYCDIIHTVEELEDADAGLLFKHYLRYINDLNPEPPSKLIKIVFEPIKQNLKRDLRKWEEKSAKNAESARIRWEKNNANASERTKRNANHADKDKDTVTDTVTDKDIIVIGKKSKNSISIKAKYLNQKPVLIYDLQEYFSTKGQLEELKIAGWTKFEQFMKINPAAMFEDDNHLYQSFKKFSTSAPKSGMSSKLH